MMPSIPELLQVPAEKRDATWLQTMLQHAVDLEFSTLPVYLCGLWSIQNPAALESAEAYNLILSVILQEMLHMGLAANMLVGVGGTPRINVDIPTYPGHLPGGVAPNLSVYLAGLSRTLLFDVFMPIEQPAWSPIGGGGPPSDPPTIGEFYNSIKQYIQIVKPTFDPRRQLTQPIDGGTVFVIDSWERACDAINEIVEQGEGTEQSPDQETLELAARATTLGEAPAADEGAAAGGGAAVAAGVAAAIAAGVAVPPPSARQQGDLAHYYKFAEIYMGRRLVQAPSGQWWYGGPPIPFPTTYPVAPIPPGGYPDLLEEIRFRQQFTTVLDNLQSAWANGSADDLNTAIAFMFTLAPLAQEIMQIPLPGGQGSYGPDFQLYPR